MNHILFPHSIPIVDFSNMLKLETVFNAIPKCSECVNSRIQKMSLQEVNDHVSIDLNEMIRHCPHLNNLSLSACFLETRVLLLNDTRGSLERLSIK